MSSKDDDFEWTAEMLLAERKRLSVAWARVAGEWLEISRASRRVTRFWVANAVSWVLLTVWFLAFVWPGWGR